MIRALGLSLLPVCLAQAALAVSLSLPGNPMETARVDDGLSSVALPNGAWDGAQVPTAETTGEVTRTAWQLRGQMITVAQIAETLTDQLTDAGWRIDFACADSECGGFDFRFASRTLPAPGMYVDLGDFRYVLASRPDADGAVALMISRGGDAAWVQVTEVTPRGGDGPTFVTSTKSVAAPSGPLARRLAETGHVVLDDLEFSSGSADLADAGADSLARVAAHLSDNPGRTFAIVGHTDSDGGWDANATLSRKRAETVRRLLIERYGVPPAQIEARGVGYLAPLGSNATEAGRLANRRVELVATN